MRVVVLLDMLLLALGPILITVLSFAAIVKPARLKAALLITVVWTLLSGVIWDWYGQIDIYVLDGFDAHNLTAPWLSSPQMVASEVAIPAVLLASCFMVSRRGVSSWVTQWSNSLAAMLARCVAFGLLAYLALGWWSTIEFTLHTLVDLEWTHDGCVLVFLLSALALYAVLRPRVGPFYSLLRLVLGTAFAWWAVRSVFAVSSSAYVDLHDIVSHTVHTVSVGLLITFVLRWTTPKGAVPRGKWCRSCGYCLAGIAAGRCPECGCDLGPVCQETASAYRSTPLTG